ncbi:MAG: hypothetical protein R2755_07825 [Acidimicrobiales bacterium]
MIYRDMNWYPTDGGNAVAPDALVLAPGALGSDDRSYKQATAGGPDPIAAIEGAVPHRWVRRLP